MRTELHRKACALLALGACVFALASSSANAEEAQASWTGVERVIAFADVHGAYDALIQDLKAAGVVDANLHWSAGKAHVVSLGDLLDRGAGSRDAMELLMRLQDEAAAAGGMLHVVLGNHEAMNLLGDLRDTTPDELAKYIPDEPPGLRDMWRGAWITQEGEGSGAKFDEHIPPGWLGHRADFAPGGRYGEWLFKLPVAIVIDDTLYMHGGPSQVLSGLSITEINRRYRTALLEYVSALDALMQEHLLRVDDAFAERPKLAEQRLAAAPAADAAAQAARSAAVQRFIAADRDPMLDADGPNWYRGAALCNEASESDVLKPLLAGLHVKRLVVGHTPARNLRVASRFDGTVIKLDAGMNAAVFHGHPAALILEGGTARVLYADEGGQPAAIPAEPLYVTSSVVDDATVAAILAKGDVTVKGTRAPKALDVVVEAQGQSVPAIFAEVGPDAMSRELAAYKLDRELKLGLVPPTVARDVQGKHGILQARPAKWVSQADVDAQALRPDGWCALAPQFELMYTFDALIDNEARTADRILYDASSWMLLLTGHDHAFDTGKGLPKHLQARPPQPGAEMKRRLQALDAAALARSLGDLLTDRERAALLARRDMLLQ